MNRRIRLQRLVPQDREQWQKLYYRHKEQRPRRRLLALKAIWDGQTLASVCRTQKVRRKTLEHWFDLFLHGGFEALLAPERRAVPQALSAPRRQVLNYILRHKTPADYGLDSFQWTAKLAQSLIQQKWGIHLGLGRLHQLFHQFGLSHQRVHRDYGQPRPAERADFVAELKKRPNCRRMGCSWRWMNSPCNPSPTPATLGRRRIPPRLCPVMNATVND